MLPDTIKPINFGTFEIEDWEEYRQRLSIPEEGAEKEFYRQVVYDHFDYFNERFPYFDIEQHSLSFIELNISEINQQIKSFRNSNEELKQWGLQYDDFEKRNWQHSMIFTYMSKNHKPPFPPVIMDTKNIDDNCWREYGRPYHLVEGTHRVSYLFRMAERGIISSNCLFKFVLVSAIKQ
ncbi:hypothetical protein [Sulfuricurvum sp.]|uniref:hypothetical protein n=1 Tax=Sulfuricurvum sp. TaxID=2025608 RepID=UPI003BB7F3FA